MITKTKLTITINQDLLKIFDSCCDYMSINKSKLISSMIKDWCDCNLPIPDKYLPDDIKGSELEKIWKGMK